MQKSGMVISRRRVVTAALLAVPLAGLGRLMLNEEVQAADVSVTIMNFKFDPTPLTIPVGTTVTWTNQDTAPHTATSDPGSAFVFDTGMLQKGQSGKITFNTAGTFTYFCTVHPNMHGTVTVTAAAANTSAAPAIPAPPIVAPPAIPAVAAPPVTVPTSTGAGSTTGATPNGATGGGTGSAATTGGNSSSTATQAPGSLPPFFNRRLGDG